MPTSSAGLRSDRPDRSTTVTGAAAVIKRLPPVGLRISCCVGGIAALLRVYLCALRRTNLCKLLHEAECAKSGQLSKHADRCWPRGPLAEEEPTSGAPSSAYNDRKRQDAVRPPSKPTNQRETDPSSSTRAGAAFNIPTGILLRASCQCTSARAPTTGQQQQQQRNTFS